MSEEEEGKTLVPSRNESITSIKEDHKGGLIEIDYDVLEALCQFKVTSTFVADHFGVSSDTIERRVKEKYKITFMQYNKIKMSKIAYQLQQKCFDLAMDGNTTALIFALKNIAGWSDKTEGQVETEVTVNVRNNRKPDIVVEATKKDDDD